MNNGVIIEYLDPFSYEYGGMTPLKDEIIFPNGCYSFLPEFENQCSLYFQSNACISFSFIHALETVMNATTFSADNTKWLDDNGFLKNGKIKLSARALATASETDPKVGNSGGKVATTADTQGLCADSLWEFDMQERNPKINNIDNYYAPLSSAVRLQMGEFAKRFKIVAEWVFIDKWNNVERRGGLQAYVNAWHERSGKYYNPTPPKTNHGVQAISSELLDVFDSLGVPSIKQLESIGDFYPWLLKINIIEKTMSLPIIENNTLIFENGDGGNFGLFLDNRIIVDDLAKIMAMWFMRNNGNTGGRTKTLIKEDWDKFPKSDLKGNKI